MNIWTYVITNNHGSAPNYERVTTLAICKPRIRKKAEVGDLVLAFNGSRCRPKEPNSVCWAGVVSEKLPIAEYWNDKRFAHKKPDTSTVPDNIYRPNSRGVLARVPNEIHKSPEDPKRDIGGEYVLIFKKSWHFGERGPDLEPSFGLYMKDNARRGHAKHENMEALLPEIRQWLNECTVVPPPMSGNRFGDCLPVKADSKKTIRKSCC